MKHLKRFGSVMMLSSLIALEAIAASNINATDKYAWSENSGWANFKDTNGGVTVYSDHLEGYVWAENIGWIRLGTYTSGGTHTYVNNSATNYGVNNDSSTLKGFAWSENAGWIKFDDSNGGVTINATGDFDGYAWGENVGWIHFQKTGTPAYKVSYDLPTINLSVNTATGTEAATTAVTVTATASAAVIGTQTVTVAASGTGITASDYTLSNTTITIPDNNTTGSVTFTVQDDNLYEGATDETATLTISSPSAGITLGTTVTQDVTITDNESPPTVTLGLSGSPLAENGGTATVTATLTNPSYQNVTVGLAFSGPAVAGTDYSKSDSIVVAAGNTSNTMTLTGSDDSLDEIDETITVDINVTGGNEDGTQTENAIITDDDPEPTVQFTAASQSIAENGGGITAILQLSAVSGKNVSIPFTVGGSATGGGTDYNVTGSPVTINAGWDTATVTITPIDEARYENNETVILTLGSPINASASGTTVHTAIITNDDTAPTVSFTAPSQNVGENAGTATITAQLSIASGVDVTVPFTVNASSTATGSSIDYSITTSPIIISASSTSEDIIITLNNDIIDEPDETVIVDMGSPTGATASGTTTHTVTIQDNDASLVINEIDYDQPTPPLNDSAEFIEIKNVSGATIDLDPYTLTLYNEGSTNVDIDLPSFNLPAGDYYVICGNNATVANCDLDHAPDIKLIQNGPQDAVALKLGTFRVDAVSYAGTATNASYTEGTGAGVDSNSEVNVSLSRYADGADTNNNSADVSLRCITPGLVNNVAASSNCYQLSINNPTAVNEGDASTSILQFTASLSTAAPFAITVDYATADNTATIANSDYVSKTGTLTFAAGDTSETVDIIINGDYVDEGASETFYVDLSDANVAIVDAQGIGTITDDDTAGFTLSKTAASVNESGTIDTFTVVLDSKPASNVVITVTSADTGEATVSATPALPLTFTSGDWNTAQTVTVTGVDDVMGDTNQTKPVTLSIDGANSDDQYDPIADQAVNVTTVDNDIPGIAVNPTTLTISEPSGFANFTIKLNTQPTGSSSVTVPLTTSIDCTISTASVTIANGAWNAGASVTVTAIDDVIDNAVNRTCTITTGDPTSAGVPADAAYEALGAGDVADVSVTVTDNDVASSTVNPTTLTTISEPSGFTTFKVTLATKPTANVTIGLTPSSECSATAAGQLTLANYSSGVDVTVTATNDNVDDGDQTCTVVTSFTSVDTVYTAINPDDVTVTVGDDDTAGVTVGAALNAIEGGATSSYTVTLDTEPTSGNITINVLSADTTQCTVAPTTLILNNGTMSGNVTITAVNDTNVEGNHTCTINHAITGGPSEYPNSMSVASVTANVTDDDPGVIITQTAGSTGVTEGGATDTYTVKLSTQPTNDVTVTVTPDAQTDVGSGAGNAHTLTAFSTNWNDAEPVTVTAFNDTAVENTHSSIISHSSTATDPSTDPGYDGASVVFMVDSTITADVTVSITDNDVPPPPAPRPTPPPSTGSTGPAPTVTPAGPVVQFAGDGSGSVSASANSSGSFFCHSSQTCPTKLAIGWYRFEPTADSDSKFGGWSGKNCNNGEYITTFGGTCIATFNLLPPPEPVVDVTPSEPTLPTPTKPTQPDVTPSIPTVSTPPVVTPTAPKVNYVGFSDQAYTVAENGGSVTVTINRTGSNGEVSVDLLTADDSGKANVDYQPMKQTLFWASGDDTQITVPVVIIDNLAVDGNKTVILSLGNATNVVLGLGTAILTIVDDDKPQTVIQPEPISPSPTAPVIPKEPVVTTPDVVTTVNSGPIAKEPVVTTPDVVTTVNSGPIGIACNSSHVLATECNAHVEIIIYQEVEEHGNLTGGILDHPLTNKGLVSNTTITPDGSLTGGKLSGHTNNEGLIEDVKFVGASINGKNADGKVVGTLGGKVVLASQIGGVVEDVNLAPDTHIVGHGTRLIGSEENFDRIGGIIRGDSDKPAILERLHIQDESNVANVILGKDVTYGDGVTFRGEISGEKEAPILLENLTIAPKSHLKHLVIGDSVVFEDGVTLDDSVTFSVHQQYMKTHNINGLPQLNNLAAIDSQSNPVSTRARFQGGARYATKGKQVENYRKKRTFKKSKQRNVDVFANVLADTRHIGQKADILVVAAYTPPRASSPTFYMLDEHGTPLPWDSDMSSLVPFQAEVKLAPVVPVQIWNSPLDILGDVQVYFGYRLVKSGELVYSLEDVIEMEFIE